MNKINTKELLTEIRYLKLTCKAELNDLSQRVLTLKDRMDWGEDLKSHHLNDLGNFQGINQIDVKLVRLAVLLKIKEGLT